MGFSVFMCCYQRNLGKGGQEPWTDKSKENFLDTVRLSRNKVEWVIEILEGKVIYVFGREGKDLIGWSQDSKS